MQLDNLVLSRREGSMIEVSFDIPTGEVKSYYDKALKDVSGMVRMPGFRKGKAPKAVVEREYSGRITAMAEDMVLRNVLEPAMEKAGVGRDELIDRPSFRRKSEFQKDEPFKLEATFTVAPSMEIKDYTGIAVERPSTEVTDEDINTELEALADRSAVFGSVDRGAEESDQVVITASGRDESGEDVPAVKMEDHALFIGPDNLLPEFKENIEGMKSGDKKTFEVNFPENYHSAELQGKKVEFTVEVVAVKEKKKPEIDDEFAKDLGFDDLSSLKEQIIAHRKDQLVRQAATKVELAIMEKLRKTHPVEDLPKPLVDEQIAMRKHRFQHAVESMGMSREDYFKVSEKSEEEYEEEILKESMREVQEKLILRTIAKQEDIEVSDQEVASIVVSMAEQAKKSPEAFMKKMINENRIAGIKNDFLERKTLDFLVDKADIKES